MGGRPVDLVHLARHTFGDPDLEREVLQLFVVYAPAYLNRLKTAGDARTWRDAAHTLKGAARGIGAWGVAEQAELAERLVFDPDGPGCRGAVASMEQEVECASRFIQVLFQGH